VHRHKIPLVSDVPFTGTLWRFRIPQRQGFHLATSTLADECIVVKKPFKNNTENHLQGTDFLSQFSSLSPAPSPFFLHRSFLKIDKARFHIRIDQLHPQPVAHIQPGKAGDQLAFNRQTEQAHQVPFSEAPVTIAFELLPEAVSSSSAAADLPTWRSTLLAASSASVAVGRQQVQVLEVVGRRLAGQDGFHQAAASAGSG